MMATSSNPTKSVLLNKTQSKLYLLKSTGWSRTLTTLSPANLTDCFEGGMKKTLVCVYGTLKKNGGNDYLLASSKMISEGLLLDHKLFFSGRGGGFPVAMKDEGSRSLCEVYEVDEPTVKNLDCLEGYNADKDRGMYLRRTSKVL